ncbi:GNAT family N-acetyltransferase [Halobacteriales archaeon Cl-PHB]
MLCQPGSARSLNSRKRRAAGGPSGGSGRTESALDAERRGIGSSLLDHIETVLKEQGFDRLQLSVMAENEGGVSFYEFNSFHRTATTHNDQLDIQQYEYRKSL